MQKKVDLILKLSTSRLRTLEHVPNSYYVDRQIRGYSKRAEQTIDLKMSCRIAESVRHIAFVILTDEDGR